MNPFSNKNGWLLVFVIFLSLVLIACGGSETTTQPIESPLGNTYWQMETYTLQETGQVQRIPDSTVVLYFAEDGSVFGFSGCNFILGGYNVSGEMISIIASPSTAYACPGQELQVQEMAFMGALTFMGSARVEGDRMVLSNPNGVEEIQFTQITPPPALAGTDWGLRSFNDGQGALVIVLEGTEITATFAENGTLSGSAGCNSYNTTYEIDGDNIIISSPMALTMMMCETPEGIMEQETQYLGALENSSIYRNLVAGLILLDENNNPTAFYLSTLE